jgi:hypothetical protein
MLIIILFLRAFVVLFLIRNVNLFSCCWKYSFLKPALPPGQPLNDSTTRPTNDPPKTTQNRPVKSRSNLRPLKVPFKSIVRVLQLRLRLRPRARRSMLGDKGLWLVVVEVEVGAIGLRGLDLNHRSSMLRVRVERRWRVFIKD